MQDILKQRIKIVNFSGIAAVVLLAATTVAFGVVPLYRQGMQNISDTDRLKTQLAALDGLSQTLSQVEAERKQTEEHLRKVEEQIPNSSETNTFIKELAKVTEAAGIQVDGTTYPKELKDSGGYKTLPVEVIGTGDWDSCYRFLTGLRSMKRLTRLDSLVLEVDQDPKGQRTGPPMCKIDVNFSTFFMAR